MKQNENESNLKMICSFDISKLFGDIPRLNKSLGVNELIFSGNIAPQSTYSPFPFGCPTQLSAAIDFSESKERELKIFDELGIKSLELSLSIMSVVMMQDNESSKNLSSIKHTFGVSFAANATLFEFPLTVFGSKNENGLFEITANVLNWHSPFGLNGIIFDLVSLNMSILNSQLSVEFCGVFQVSCDILIEIAGIWIRGSTFKLYGELDGYLNLQSLIFIEKHVTGANSALKVISQHTPPFTLSNVKAIIVATSQDDSKQDDSKQEKAGQASEKYTFSLSGDCEIFDKNIFTNKCLIKICVKISPTNGFSFESTSNNLSLKFGHYLTIENATIMFDVERSKVLSKNKNAFEAQ
eukprot:414272_1